MISGSGTPYILSLIAKIADRIRLSATPTTPCRKTTAALLLLISILLPISANAADVNNSGSNQDTAPDSVAVNVATPDSVAHFSEIIFFRCDKINFDPNLFGNAERLENIRRFLSENDSIPGLTLSILGSASPEGPKAHNVWLSQKRAGRLAALLRDYTTHPIDTTARPTLTGARSEWPRLRFAEFYAEWPVPTRRRIEPIHIEVLPPTLDLDIIPIDTTLHFIPIEFPAKRKLKIPPFFLSTNFLQDAVLTPQIGLGFPIYKQLTFFIDYYHAWWFNRPDRFCWRWYGGDVELRWQLGHGKTANRFAGHWVGAYFSTYTYDFQFGRDKEGVQGNKYNHAIGLSYGYSLPIARRFHLNFLIGVGYQWGRYYRFHTADDYHNANDHDVWLQTKHRRFFGPTRAEVGISWLIGTDNVNIFKPKKGGGR